MIFKFVGYGPSLKGVGLNTHKNILIVISNLDLPFIFVFLYSICVTVKYASVAELA